MILRGNHFPVTSLDWSSDGKLLATASISDSDILIWDVDQNRNTPLRRIGAPCSLLLWSPDGSSVFTSTVGNVFRVWSTNQWTPERWTVPTGSVQSAAWSPCGGFLVFVTTDESLIYSLCFIEEQLFASEWTFDSNFKIQIYVVLVFQFRLLDAQTSAACRRSRTHHRRRRSGRRSSAEHRLGSGRSPFGRHIQGQRIGGHFPDRDQSHEAEFGARLLSGGHGRRSAVVRVLPGALQEAATGHGADHWLVERPSAVLSVSVM